MSLSHSFNVQIASEFSIEIALFLNHFQFWHNRAKNNAQNMHENKIWVRLKAEQIQEIYPYFTIRQIRYYLQKMVDLDLLLHGEFNIKKSDRTKWYSLTKKAKKMLNMNTKKEGYENVTNKGDENVTPSYENVTSKYKEVDIKDRYIIIKEKLQQNLGLIESIAINNKLKINTVSDSIIQFVLENQEIKKFYQNDTEIYRHFRFWVPKQIFKENSLETELEWFMSVFNKISRRDFKTTETVKKRFAQQFAVGYSGVQMAKAVENLYSSSVGNKFHIVNHFKFATPEYLLKDDNLNKYLNFKVA